MPEILLRNAHDGGAAYRIYAGIFRLICSNGMIVADATLSSYRVTHSGNNIQDDVINASRLLTDQMPKVFRCIDYWRSVEMTSNQREEFAERALTLRFEDGNIPISPGQVLVSRRAADDSHDLFTTMNVVQENLLRGGQSYFMANRNGGKTTSRRLSPIRGMEKATQINLGIWELAEMFSQN